VVIHAERPPGRRTVEPGVAVQQPVQHFDVKTVRYLLGRRPVAAGDDHVVDQLAGDAAFFQLSLQPVVPVEIELQSERAIRRDPQVAQSQERVDEVEVVMQAFATVGLEEGLAGPLVVPGLIGRTGLQGREDMHQAGMPAPLPEDLPHAVFLAEVELLDVLNRRAGFGRQALGIPLDLLGQRLGEERVVEDADAAGVEDTGHPLGVAGPRQRARDDDAVKARELTHNLLSVALDKRRHGKHTSGPKPSGNA